MAIRKSGYTSSTSKHYVLDAGAIYRNLKYDGTDWNGTLLGATAEGSTLTIEQTYRQIEVDGVKVNVKGGKVLETAMASLEANVKELTAENYRRAINGTIREALPEEAPAGYKVIESKMHVEDTDFDDNIAYVGTLSGTKEPVIIILDNTFVTSPLEQENADKAEAVIAMTFEAHASDEQIENEELPWRIFYPSEAVEEIVLNKETLELIVGGAETLVATTKPADATVTWESGNPSVATVDSSGLVTAVAEGTATITATANGYSDTCTVTINAA